MIGLTTEQVALIAPRISYAWSAALIAAMMRRSINTVFRATAFIAQCAHESAGFTRFEENLNYSANGLMATWPKRFPTLDVALLYARDPVRIANRAYADRLGNRAEASGDGWRYRGRGCIQITGRDNYRAAGAALRFPLESMPDEAETPSIGAEVAAWFWEIRGLNVLADAEDFHGITRRINGGLVGLADREQWLAKARNVLT